MGRFDNVDLGGDKTMQRMIKAARDERNALIDECASIAETVSTEAAQLIRNMKTE